MLENILQSLRSTIFATPTLTSFQSYLIYYVYICVASIIIPAKIVNGHPQPKRGSQLQYSINGFKLTCLTIFIVFVFGGVIPAFSSFKVFSVVNLTNQFWSLWSVVNIFAMVVAVLLYLKGKYGSSYYGEYHDSHSHGNLCLDFWVGRQLNPRIGTFDIKFIAYRVAMIFWLVINISFLAKQLEETHQITNRMIVYQLTTAFYVLDYFWNQQKMLTTWDIISEEFGYMLVFGDYVFIPFVFSVQAHYLINYPDFQQPLLPYFIIFLFAAGYYLFRNSNSQKNQFKMNPTQKIWGKAPEALEGKLLISGFWGISRHMNYTGDLIMGLAYCLPCGMQLGGYTYAIYLYILLTHRAYRDDTKCRQKYQTLWEKYNQKVKFVFLPIAPLDYLMTNCGKMLYLLTNRSDVVQNEALKAEFLRKDKKK